MNNRPPTHPYERATEDQTWERSSLMPFLRHYYRISDDYPNSELDAEIARATRILDCLDRIRHNPDTIHALIQGITVPPLRANGEPEPPLYPNYPGQQGDDNRLLVTMVLMYHARVAPPLWLPPRPPAERINEPIRNRVGTGQVRYPNWSHRDALIFEPPAPDPNWTGETPPHGQPVTPPWASRGRGGSAPRGRGGHAPQGYGNAVGPGGSFGLAPPPPGFGPGVDGLPGLGPGNAPNVNGLGALSLGGGRGGQGSPGERGGQRGQGGRGGRGRGGQGGRGGRGGRGGGNA